MLVKGSGRLADGWFVRSRIVSLALAVPMFQFQTKTKQTFFQCSAFCVLCVLALWNGYDLLIPSRYSPARLAKKKVLSLLGSPRKIENLHKNFEIFKRKARFVGTDPHLVSYSRIANVTEILQTYLCCTI